MLFDEDVEGAVAEAFRTAVEAAGGGDLVDDLVLLDLLLGEPDDDLLRAVGSRVRQLASETRRELDAVAGAPRPMPGAEDLVRFAATEAIELGGYGAAVRPIHVVLALFAFHGSSGEEVLRRCGLDWRPLRSIVRRLGLGF